MISGILLAGGASTRMGRPKALLEYRGVPFLRAVAAALLTGGVEELVGVLNPAVPGLPELLPVDARVRWVAAPPFERCSDGPWAHRQMSSARS